MKKKIQIITTLGPSSLNAAFLKFSNNNIDLLRLNMSHIEPEELEEEEQKTITKNASDDNTS